MIFDQIIERWYWREPLWLSLIFIPIVILIWKNYIQQSLLNRYASPEFHPWVISPASKVNKQSKLHTAIFVIGWLLLSAAMAGPRLLEIAPPDILPEPAEVMIIVDQSRSMQANATQDQSETHYSRALNLIEQWINQNRQIKYGLMLFAGHPHTLTPPATDTAALNDLIKLSHKLKLPSHGSAIDKALEQALPLFSNNENKTIIVFTDGDFEPDQYVALNKSLDALTRNNISLHFIGVGSLSATTLIDENGDWLKYEGDIVTTRLHEGKLTELAKHPSVTYQRFNPSQQINLYSIWKPDPQRISTDNIDRVLWLELFPYFLFPAMIILFISHIELNHLPKLSITIVVIITGLITLLIQPAITQANNNTLEEAYDAWFKNNYAQAVERYSKIPGFEARMGEGASCYRNDQLDCAVSAFKQAAWLAEDDIQRGKAVYNLGNSYFKQGDLPAAITSYRDALRYQPDNATFNNNLSFTIEVQQQIDLRLKQEAESLRRRISAGEHMRDIDPDTIITPDTPLTLGDTEERFDDIVMDEVLQQYLLRYKAQLKLKGSRTSNQQRHHDWDRYSNENPVAVSQLQFWQHLFELEEGITAQQLHPRVIPGVRPW